MAYFETWDLAWQPIVWQNIGAPMQMGKYFQSLEGHSVGVGLHSL
jgi:hypothetical protein